MLTDISARVLAPVKRGFDAPHLHVIDDATRRRERRYRRTAVLFSSVSVIALLAAVVFHVQVAQTQFRVERIESETALEKQRYKDLRLQMAELTSPEKILAEAENRGLVLPGQVTYVSGGLSGASSPTERRLAEWEKAKRYLDDQN